MSFKELRDALDQVALNPEYLELSAEELEEAHELCKLIAVGLHGLRERRLKENECEDEVQARKT